MKVALDGGHALVTLGKETPDREKEWTFNDTVIKACEQELKRYEGVEILRLDDPTGKRDIPLNDRILKAKAWGAKYLVSGHHNANQGKWGGHGGVETLIQTGASKASLELAQIVQPLLVKAMGLRDRGIKRRSDLHILNAGEAYKMVTILTEGGFMDSITDIAALRDPRKLRDQGIALATGIAQHAKLKLKEVVKVEQVIKLTPNQQKDKDLLVKHGFMGANFEVKSGEMVALITVQAAMVRKLEAKGVL